MSFVPVVHAGSGSCPAAGPNTIAAPAGPCTLAAGDSVDVTASGSIGGTAFAIAVQDGDIAGSIANDGTLDASTTIGAVGLTLGADSGLSGGLGNSGTISATATDRDATGIRLAPRSSITGGLLNDGTINVSFNSGSAYGIDIDAAEISGTAIENRGVITVHRGGVVDPFAQGIGISFRDIHGGIMTAPIINAGTVTVDGGDGSVFGLYLQTSSVISSVTNEFGATIDVRSNRFAHGVFVQLASNLTHGLFNHGTISATADGLGLRAVGVRSGAGSDIDQGVVNSGLITARAVVEAHGILVVEQSKISGGVVNSGTIEASGGAIGAGISVSQQSDIAGGVTNSGVISGDSAGGSAHGIVVDSDSMISGGIINSGTISGTTYSLNLQNTTQAFTIENSGTLNGDVALGINSLVLDGSDVTVNGVVSGTSAARAEIRGTTSFASDLRFAGVGTVAIMPDARLVVRAARTITSSTPVVNNGTIAIAAEGRQTIAGDYVHGAGAAIAIEVAGSTTYGRLIVEGEADITHFDTVTLGVTADEFVYGDILEDVISADRIMGAGDIVVVDDSEPMAFRARVDGNTIDIIAAPSVSFSELVSGFAISGLTGIGGALDGVIAAGNSDDDMRALFQTLSAMGSAREIADALVQLTPTLQASTGQFAKASIGMTNAVLGRRIDARGATWSAGDNDDPLARSAGWVMPFSSWTDHDGQGGLSGYGADTWGLGGGVDSRFLGERLLLGVGFSQSSSDVTGDAAVTRSRLDVTSRQAFLYADFALDPRTSFGFTAGGGAANIESSRRINVGAIEHFVQGDYGSWDAFVNMDLGRAYAFGPITTLTPQLRFEYVHVDTGSYTENGGGGLALAIRESTLDQALLSAGVHVLVEATPQLDVTARGAVGVDLIDDDPNATGSFLGGGPAFVLEGLKQDATVFRGGVGLKYRSHNDRASFHLRYDAEGQDNYTNQIMSMQFRLRF